MNTFPVVVEWFGPYWRVTDLGVEPIADRVVAEVKSKWLANWIAYFVYKGIA
jgi:hypothetical protein